MAHLKSLTVNGVDIIDLIYPVGSFYFSTKDTPPSELFGGTWEQIKGRFLLGTGSIEANSTDYWGTVTAGGMSMPVGETGGQYEHIQTEAEMPKHVHQQSLADNGTLSQAAYTWSISNTARLYGGLDLAVETGGSQPMKIMPPYYATYIWHRTA